MGNFCERKSPVVLNIKQLTLQMYAITRVNHSSYNKFALPFGPKQQESHLLDTNSCQRFPQSAEHVHYIEGRARNYTRQDPSGNKHPTGGLASLLELI